MTSKTNPRTYIDALKQCATVEDVKALVHEYDADIGEKVKEVDRLREEANRLTDQANQIEDNLPGGVWANNFHAKAACRAGEIALGMEELE